MIARHGVCLLLCLLVQVSSLAQPPSKTASPTKATTSAASTRTISEVAAIVAYPSVTAKGSIDFQGCPLSFTGTYESIGDERVPQESSVAVNLGLVPGVQHRFRGETCLPGADPEGTWSKSELRGKGENIEKGGRWAVFFKGPINVSGKLDLT